jgi:hypothetical protein
MSFWQIRVNGVLYSLWKDEATGKVWLASNPEQTWDNINAFIEWRKEKDNEAKGNVQSLPTT